MSRIVDAFDNICFKKADSVAMVYRNGKKVCKKSFGELESDVNRMVSYFKSCNIKCKDKILTFASSSYKLCVFMLASLKIGASIMYVDIWAKQSSIESVFEDYKPDVVLVSDKTKHLRLFFGQIGKIQQIINIDRFEKYPYKNQNIEAVAEDTIALLTMTTGSTGKPKIALRTHRDLMQQLDLINANLECCEAETVLTTSYIYVFANILNGFTTVLPMLNLGRYSKHRVDRILRLFCSEPISMIITSPDFCLKADNNFSHLKTLYFGGAILNLFEAELIREKFKNCSCNVIYGSTECNLIATCDLDEFIETLKSKNISLLGYAAKGVDIRLGKNNEILVSSQALLENYLIEDETTKETDKSGTLWHNTNDIGTFEDDKLCFLGKSGQYIMVDNKKIYSNSIEQKIVARFKSISKCAMLSHNGKTFVFLQKGKADNAEISEFLSSIGIFDAKIINIRKIPCDVKHHTKINYNKLKERLK